MATIKTIVLVVFLLAGVGIGIFEFAGSLLESYGGNMEGNLSRTETNLRNTLSGTSDLTEEMQTEISEAGAISVAAGFAIFTKALLAAIKLPFQLIGLTTTLISDLMMMYGVPQWVFTTTIGTIILLLVIAVFSAVFNRRSL